MIGSIIRYFLPNFSGIVLIGFWTVLAGIMLVVASFFVSPFPRVSGRVRGLGVMIAAFGAVAWIFASFVDDVLSNPKTRTVLMAAGIVLLLGFLLFWEPKTKRKGKKR